MTPALVAVSHGTDVPEARAAVSALVTGVRMAAPHLDVREAFVDVQHPRVGQVVEEVGGPSVVVPLLLAPGVHVSTDIGRAVDGEFRVAARTLGPDGRLADLLLRRLSECGAVRDDRVVLAAAGSTDAGAHRSVEAMAGLLGAAWGSPVRVGHLGGTGTPIDQAVRDVARTGRRIVVATYLMAAGVFHERLRRCGAHMVTAPLLDDLAPSPCLVTLVLDRFAEAAAALQRGPAAHGVLLPRGRGMR